MLQMLENQVAATGSKDKNNICIYISGNSMGLFNITLSGASGCIAMFVVTYCVDL